MNFQSLLGKTLGTIEIREFLARGGMAAVYLGYQARLKREVAVKVLLDNLLGDQNYLARFVQEAQIAGRLEHAHIVPIYEYGALEGTHYVAMRLLRGGTLAERITRQLDKRQEIIAIPDLVVLLKQIAEALDYAHAQDVLHRDIKPSNIMFDSQGNAYLVDFGIAKPLNGTMPIHTQLGSAMGTAAYMSPEQWKDEPQTPKVDQYALGLVLYLLLTGHQAFDEENTIAMMMNKHLEEMPPPIYHWRPDLPHNLDHVIRRAIAKNPEDRYPTLSALYRDVRRNLAHLLTSTTSLQVPTPNHSTPLTEEATIQLAIPVERGKGTSVPSSESSDQTDPMNEGATSSVLLTTPELPSIPIEDEEDVNSNSSFRPNTLWIGGGVLALIVLASLLFFSRSPQTTPTVDIGALETAAALNRTPVSTTPAATTSTNSMTTTAVGLVILPSATSTATLTSTSTLIPTNTATYTATATPLPTQTPTPSYTPTSLLSATVSPTNTPLPTETPTSTATVTATMTATATNAPSPTATFTVTASPMPSHTPTSTNTAVPTATFTATPLPPINMASRLIPGRIVFASNRNERNYQIFVMIPDGSSVKQVVSSEFNDYYPRWSPDGQYVAFVRVEQNRYKIMLANADGSAVRALTDDSSNNLFPEWAPDSQHIVFTTDRNGNQDVYLLNISTGETQQLLTGVAQDQQASFAPDGQRLVFTSSRDGNNELYLMHLGDRSLTRLTNNTADDSTAHFSPDGQFIAFRSDRDSAGYPDIYILTVDNLQTQRLTYSQSGTSSSDPYWSPDGLYVVYWNNGNLRNIFLTRADGTDSILLTNGQGNNFVPAWAP